MSRIMVAALCAMLFLHNLAGRTQSVLITPPDNNPRGDECYRNSARGHSLGGADYR